MSGAVHTLERLRAARVIAVLRVDERERTAPAVAALRKGGLRAIEITWTSPEPAAELAAARETLGADVLLGAGTLRSTADVEAAVDAGADFLVSPHLNRSLLEAMLGTGKLALPGVLTPTEVAAALDAGAEVVKLFPSSLGGVDYLRALFGPFPDLAVVPTGGVRQDNVRAWLDAGSVAVGASGELCPRDAIAAGRWDELTEAARRFLEAAGT
jgi:2-dehydro-3-deoxyphosphogluconate aldolase / (4S)-4-hydroxy-2-oxoglutarate aldolase